MILYLWTWDAPLDIHSIAIHFPFTCPDFVLQLKNIPVHKMNVFLVQSTVHKHPVNCVVINIDMNVSFGAIFRYKYSCSMFYFSFQGNFHADFYRSCKSLHSQQQWIRTLLSIYPDLHFFSEHSIRTEMDSQSSLNLHFSNHNGCWTLFQVFLDNLYLFWELSGQFIGPLIGWKIWRFNIYLFYI